MRYPCGVGHMGAVRVCWHEGSSRGYMYISVYHVVLCRYTNKRTRKLSRVEIDYIIESVCCHGKSAYIAICISIGKILVRTYRAYIYHIMSYHV